MGAKIRCKLCEDIIESKHRHDFVRCKCGAIFIDGGNDYLRTGWNPDKGTYEECIEIVNE